MFWSEYTNFYQKVDTFSINKFIWINKDVRDGNSHLWHHKYCLPCTKVLCFVDFRVTSNIPGIKYLEHSWGDVKTIKSGNRSAPGSEIYDNQIIVYTYAYIKEARIVKTLSKSNSNDISYSHSWNDYDHAFEYQLYKWGGESCFILLEK